MLCLYMYSRLHAYHTYGRYSDTEPQLSLKITVLVVMFTDGHGTHPADCNDGNDLVQKLSKTPLSGWESRATNTVTSNFRSYSVHA